LELVGIQDHRGEAAEAPALETTEENVEAAQTT
jgi:hypothetical protein